MVFKLQKDKGHLCLVGHEVVREENSLVSCADIANPPGIANDQDASAWRRFSRHAQVPRTLGVVCTWYILAGSVVSMSTTLRQRIWGFHSQS